jgi:double-strand break repair protein MRE11
MPEPDSWFSILVLHQNRIAHAEKNYVHEDMLGDFFDFVVWGHEHECKIQPVKSAIQRFFISQPGSSVATSLSEFEAKQKYVYPNCTRSLRTYLTTVQAYWRFAD